MRPARCCRSTSATTSPTRTPSTRSRFDGIGIVVGHDEDGDRRDGRALRPCESGSGLRIHRTRVGVAGLQAAGLGRGVGLRLRRIRPAEREAPGSVVHVGKRLLRHPRRRSRVEGGAGALPRYLRRRGVQPPRRRGGGHGDRQRESGQPAQLAGPDLPHRRRRLVRRRRGHGALVSADARPSTGGARPRGEVPRRRGPDDVADATATRGDAPAPRRRPRDDGRSPRTGRGRSSSVRRWTAT